MNIEQQTVPFFKLIAPDEINARPKTTERLDDLAASIKAKGIIVPLAVRANDKGKFEIIDGRRRHAAIGRLVKSKTLGKDYEVPVIVRDDDDVTALETSMVANSERLPPHPVDQHDVFVRLADQHGLSDAEIADRFGISDRTVRQHKALGTLAKPIRDAYRKGIIDVKAAQTFTRAEDPAVQLEAFERLKKRGKHFLTEHFVRSELSDEREPAKQSRTLKFVGEEAYVAAGGKLSIDLFEDERLIDDMPLLKKLARSKLDVEVKRLKAEGWKWAKARLDDDDGDFDRWLCGYVKGDDEDESDDPADFSPAERKKSGCIVEIDHLGKLEFHYGLIKPDKKKPAAAADEWDGEDDISADDDAGDEETDFVAGDAGVDDGPAGPFDLSQALMERVTTQLTVAASRTLAQDTSLALRVITAALLSSNDSPASITNSGHKSVRDIPDQYGSKFGKEFAKLAALGGGDRLDRAFAAAAATTLNLVSFNLSYGSKDAAAKALIPALIGSEYLEQARAAFDAVDYFGSSKKEAALEAIEEMRPAATSSGAALNNRQAHAGLKKAELAELASRMAKKHGWLPPELRHPDYELIGAKSSAVAGKKRKAA